ncbi:cyclase family protein [Psychrilyobacter atlanticus]|uniref:cyclase family protein n=1 Tax=Psychrilyobacter atlanticus TaxID=271091 RepID=UPI0003F9FD7C|nr:cyclase family protein [Psychrilyobacter atlanticus]
MEIIDLTHVIDEKMPVFPGTEPPKIIQKNTIKKDGFAEKLLTMYSHTGTHIDAPAHMIQGGYSLNDFPIEKFIGRGIIIPLESNDIIELNYLKKFEFQIKKASFVLFYSGWDDFWGRKEYFNGFPSLSIEAAKYLVGFDLKGVGIDAVSIDAMDSKNFDVHHILLKKNLIIIENLKNLKKLINKNFELYITPLKIKDLDGSPVRAFGKKL